MAAAAKAAARPWPRASGLSLMEMLVVFVLVALLGTLVIQGMAFFSGRYEAVRDRHGATRQAMLRQHWFVVSVRGLVPYDVDSRRFVGVADGFTGVTLAPLNAEPGLPVLVRWRIVEDAGSRTVHYLEDGGAATSWTVLASDADLAFEYRDMAQGWHDRWPLQDAPEQPAPTGVRLLQGGQTLWLANVDAHPFSGIAEDSLR